MTDKEKKILELFPDASITLAEGFDEALMGVAQIFNKYIAIYNREACIDILITRDNLTSDEAEEYFEFNVIGSYVGENTPGFLSSC